MVIIIFGDSITQGYWDEKGGWADRIKKFVMDSDLKRGFKGYHGVFNLGIDANFTHHVIERFDDEIGVRKFPGADINSDYGVIFAIGVNDTLHKDSSFESTPERYGKELKILLQKARQLTTRIAFVNLLPVNEMQNNKDTSSDGRFYTNDRIKLFNGVLEGFCRDNKLTLIDVRSLFTSNYELLSSDGTHPTTRGHETIYSSVLPVIKSWLYK
ncbi:MAG TPA: SGNH/GDSL hydrolase family protein [Candidatus Saccharimonadales bacterium]